MAATATELYRDMLADIVTNGYIRKSEDPMSPMQGATWEARPGCVYRWRDPYYCIPEQVPFNPMYARAMLLHFFSGREDAEPLLRFKNAEKFITDGKWLGAYGAVAMSQILGCIEMLCRSPYTRRALVQMAGAFPQDANRPHCWNTLHFLLVKNKLHMMVYQRSLNLAAIMPYDAVLFWQVLSFVARSCHFNIGEITWQIGSLHATDVSPKMPNGENPHNITYTPELLSNPEACWRELCNVVAK